MLTVNFGMERIGEKRKYDHKSNQEFWHNKIENNITRDKLVNRKLRKSQWKVLRFWGKQVQKNLDFCILKIESTIIEKRKSLNDIH